MYWAVRRGRRIIIHTGAGQPVRAWPADRLAEIARRLSLAGWDVRMLDGGQGDFDSLLDLLATADRFIGNPPPAPPRPPAQAPPAQPARPAPPSAGPLISDASACAICGTYVAAGASKCGRQDCPQPA